MGALKRFFIFLLIFSLLSNIALAEIPPPSPSISPPSITSVSPNSGSNSSNTEITISGSNFSSQASGKIGSVNLLDLKWIDQNTIKAVVPSGLTAGGYDIEIINPGNFKGTLPNGFTVTAPENSGSSSSSGGGGGGSSPSSDSGGGSPVSSVQPAVPTGKIKGRIINTSGIPILGLPARINNVRMATTITGEFEFTLVVDGIYTVYYEADGYISQTQVLRVSGGRITIAPTVIMFLAGPTGKIKGRIINTSGIPILGLPARINNTRMATTITGEFEFTLVVDGIYTVYYEADGYISQTQVLVVLNGGATLAPTVILSSTVIVPISSSSVSTSKKKVRKVRKVKRAKKFKRKR